LRYHDQATSLTALKAERPTLASVHSQVVQNVALRIELAFEAFFRRTKAGEAQYNPAGSSAARHLHEAFLLLPTPATSLGTRKPSCVWTAHVSSPPLLAPAGGNGDGSEGLEPPHASPHALKSGGLRRAKARSLSVDDALHL
jgi:hypothetical protein